MQIDKEQTPLLDLTFASTFHDFREATRVWSMNSGKGRRIRYLFFVKYGYLTAVTWIVIGIAALYSQSSPIWQQTGLIGNMLEVLFLLCVGSLGGGAVLLFNPMIYLRRLRRIFKQGYFDHEGSTKFYADGLIVIRKDGSARSSLDWEALERWAESEGVFVMMPSKIQYTWVPKRILSQEQQEQLRQLLATKIQSDSSSR